MEPFVNLEKDTNSIIRLFDENIDPTNLKWHRDKEDRFIEVIGETDWMVQLENKLPENIDKIFIQRKVWHRLIKGTGELKIKIYEMAFKTYEQFNESIADIFKSAHAAIDPDDLIPLEELVGKPRFPTQEEFEEAVEYLDIDPSCLYYNSKDIIAPIMYWDGLIYEPFHGGLNMEALKMMRVKDRLDYKKKDVKKFLDSKDYDRLFTFMDKKILIPSFIKMYDEIPDKDKYEIFKDLYVRSEYGFQSFPIEIIKDCFSKRSLSPGWKKRIAEFSKVAKLKADGSLTIYRGENVDSAKGDDAFSWTLNKKTAKFFADRFSKGSGRIIEKIVKPEEVIDFLEDRGETEVILFPKKFGKINESSQDENFTDVLLIRGGRIAVRFVLYPNSVKAIQQHANSLIKCRLEWFTIDKDANFSTETNATEKGIVEKLGDMFETVIAQDKGEVAALTKAPIFMKWWKDVNHRYRGTMMGKKFGL